jgi:hypothetical protein
MTSVGAYILPLFIINFFLNKKTIKVLKSKNNNEIHSKRITAETLSFRDN